MFFRRKYLEELLGQDQVTGPVLQGAAAGILITAVQELAVRVLGLTEQNRALPRAPDTGRKAAEQRVDTAAGRKAGA